MMGKISTFGFASCFECPLLAQSGHGAQVCNWVKPGLILCAVQPQAATVLESLNGRSTPLRFKAAFVRVALKPLRIARQR